VIRIEVNLRKWSDEAIQPGPAASGAIDLNACWLLSALRRSPWVGLKTHAITKSAVPITTIAPAIEQSSQSAN
jgi:hypothetical protein